jgi:hypothetical protein
MTNPEKNAAKMIAGMILKEYGEADNRLGQQFHAMAQGNEDVARECILMMATMHLQGAVALMKMAGMTPQKIAEEFYTYADKHATD